MQASRVKPNEPETIHAPNVRLAADAEPLGAGVVTVGNEVWFDIPDEATQASGFYAENWKALIRLYPDKFKQIIDKANL